jgi:hypothetical protein
VQEALKAKAAVEAYEKEQSAKRKMELQSK